MPARSPLAGSLNQLEDYDVALLHEIVANAVQSPDVETHPFRAIYTSYESVLTSHGIDKAHDNVYLRFLFKLRHRGAPGQTLYGRFEELLLEHGIQIELGSEQDHDTERDENETFALETSRLIPSSSPFVAQPTPRSRRASFSSFYDQEDDRTGPDRRRPGSRASFSHVLEDTNPLSPGPNWPTANGHAVRPWDASMITHATPSRAKAALRRQPGERHISESVQYAPQHPVGSAAIPALSTAQNLDNHGADSAARSQLSAANLLAYRPSNTQLVRDAYTFEHFRLRALLRGILQKWKELAHEQGHRARLLHSRATQHDRDVLVRQALAIWHADFVNRRSMRETEHFFEQLEQRAVHARDTYLLGKAFSHWAQCTAEEVERTSLARQHLVKYKHFQAWREYTVVNELKVRRLGLHKAFRTWAQCHAVAVVKNEQVYDIRNHMMLRRTFAQWRWSVRERRVARSYDARLRHTTLDGLLAKYRTIEDKQVAVINTTRREALQTWQRRTALQTQLQQQAVACSRRHLLQRAFEVWQRQCRYVPLSHQVSSMVDSRIMASTFLRMVQQFDLQQDAKSMDRKRLLHHALSAWNTRLRWQSLSKKVVERVAVECLYKWVLVERCSLFYRLHTERLMRRCIAKLVGNWSKRSNSLSQAFEACKQAQEKRALKTVVKQWWNKTRTYQRHESAAVARNDQRVATQAYGILTSYHTKVQMLQNQYLPNAVLWFKGKQTLAIWNSATKKSQSKKRHEAYVIVKRKVKMDLCRKLITNWRDHTRGLLELKDVAAQLNQNQLLGFGAELFDSWRDQSRDIVQERAQVQQEREMKLLRRQWTAWVSRHQRAEEQVALSIEHDSEHSRRAAYKCLRTLHFRIRRIQDLNGGTAVADFQQWSRRRRDRSLLRLWLEKALLKRGVPEQEMPPTSRTRRFKNLLKDGPQIPPSRETSPQEDVMVSSTPALAFPTTPSRRLGRSLRTPARPGLRATQNMAPITEPEASAMPATYSAMRTNTAFGRSMAGVRRSLFAPVPGRSAFS